MYFKTFTVQFQSMKIICQIFLPHRHIAALKKLTNAESTVAGTHLSSSTSTLDSSFLMQCSKLKLQSFLTVSQITTTTKHFP